MMLRVLVCADVHCRFSGVIQGWRPKLVEAGIQELVFEDAMDLLLEHVRLGL